MIGIQHINKIREYCDYVEEHLLNVEKSWDILQVACKDMNIIYDDYLFWNIDAMVRAHDVSKMSSEEFIPYQRNFFPFGEKDESGFTKAKTVGKLIDNWITLEGLFPIVLLCWTDGKQHKFITQSDGFTTAKSPMDMFPTEIDNDLAFVDKTIREYYEFENNESEEKK